MKAKFLIVWDRETGETTFDLDGMSHSEAERLLLHVAHANFEHALEESAGKHTHEAPHPPTPSPSLGEGEQ